MERGVASRGVVAGAERRAAGPALRAGPAKADLQRNSTASRRASSRAMSTKLFLVHGTLRTPPSGRGRESPHSAVLEGHRLGESKAFVTPASRSKACYFSYGCIGLGLASPVRTARQARITDAMLSPASCGDVAIEETEPRITQRPRHCEGPRKATASACRWRMVAKVAASPASSPRSAPKRIMN